MDLGLLKNANNKKEFFPLQLPFKGGENLRKVRKISPLVILCRIHQIFVPYIII